jgi:hypothetical protein
MGTSFLTSSTTAALAVATSATPTSGLAGSAAGASGVVAFRAAFAAVVVAVVFLGAAVFFCWAKASEAQTVSTPSNATSVNNFFMAKRFVGLLVYSNFFETNIKKIS